MMRERLLAKIAYYLAADNEPPAFLVAETIAHEHPRLAARFNSAMKRHRGSPVAALEELSDSDLAVLGNVIEAHS